MYLKESLEMIFTACTHYDMETQNGKLGSDRVYEGSYEQAFDTVVDELEKREKEIEEMKQNKFSFEDWVMRTKISKDKIREKLEELKDKEQELDDGQEYWGDTALLLLQFKIEFLKELLEESE